MKGTFIKEITYPECCEQINENTVIVLPIGGGSKEHGSHLPMGTDYYVTDYLAAELLCLLAGIDGDIASAGDGDGRTSDALAVGL